MVLGFLRLRSLGVGRQPEFYVYIFSGDGISWVFTFIFLSFKVKGVGGGPTASHFSLLV